jgi:uncharacterized phiE125 gp8 family phage protein
MQLALVTGPAKEPVTVQQLKNRLRIADDTTQDDYLNECIVEARRAVEEYLGLSLFTQTWRAIFDRDELSGTNWDEAVWHAEDFDVFLSLPCGPVQSVTSVKAYDSEQVESSLAAEDFKLVANGETRGTVGVDSSALPTMRAHEAVVITYVAGQSSLDAIGPVYKGAVLRLAVEMFLNPGKVDAAEFLEGVLGGHRAVHL